MQYSTNSKFPKAQPHVPFQKKIDRVEITVPLFLVGVDFAKDVEGVSLALDLRTLRIMTLVNSD